MFRRDDAVRASQDISPDPRERQETPKPGRKRRAVLVEVLGLFALATLPAGADEVWRTPTPSSTSYGTTSVGVRLAAAHRGRAENARNSPLTPHRRRRPRRLRAVA